MKYASKSNISLNILGHQVSAWLFPAVFLYGLSFLLTIKVLETNDLSIASPMMAGLTFFLVALTSYFILGEGFNAQKILGVCFVVLGIVFLARSTA